ncbi:MAG: transporter substrate-binding domain-containing protein [Alphaproteobacteria bacterium]|nr:transporter substrate-binding domain-containing protein [Alphaproteobacteria bacterium]
MCAATARDACRQLVVLASLVFAGVAPSGAAEFNLTSLEWPPFAGQALPGKGVNAAVVAAAYSAVGDTVAVEFYPWARAVEIGLKRPGYVGYFPEYLSDSLRASCDFSRSIGESQLGFAERAAHPVRWESLADLRALRIGTVNGYVNTDEFDGMAAAGTIRVEPVVDDSTNLRKLAGGRLDLAVIDRAVMAHLLRSEPALRPLAGALRFNQRLLERKSLHVCFRRDAAGAAAKARMESGLDGIDLPLVIGRATLRLGGTG